ncbi:MAG: hypothetical protein CVV02_14600 [Firmicutes bacterium HGW-Firmicutes-7]|nr:MAG: hypothetical protein CVV02_14600 [Firmicutes bacterium HGW-Firmicutes-7]
MKKVLFMLIVVMLISTSCVEEDLKVAKPVIYLYPEVETSIKVKLDYKGELACTYPQYNNGWNVISNSDGRIINQEDNLEYSNLLFIGYP